MQVVEVGADVLFVDTMIRAGRGRGYFPIEPPYVPGNGAGGAVVDIGPGVDAGWLGQPVVAHTGGPGGAGGYAERVVAGLDHVTPVPEATGMADAVAVLHDGTTALRICELMAVAPGERVLVLGAAGGMGLLLVQLMRAAGATVTGAARGKVKLDVVAQAGADPVDYSRPGWTAGMPRPDVVLDGVGGHLGAEGIATLVPGGRVSTHGAAAGGFAPTGPAQDVTTIADLQLDAATRARLTRSALGEVAAGRLSPLVGQTQPLAEAAAAHRAMEQREALAKTLLVPDRTA